MKNTNVKRTTVLRNKEKRSPRETVLLTQAGIFLLSFLLASFIIIFDREPMMRGHEFVIGEPSPRTLFSPFELNFVDEKATALLREQKSREVPLVFRSNPQVLKQTRSQVEVLFSALYQIKKKKEGDVVLVDIKPPLALSPDSSRLLLEGDTLEQTRKLLETLLERYLNQEIIDDQTKVGLGELKGGELLIVNPETKTDKVIAVKNLATVTDVRNGAEQGLKEMVPKDQRLRSAVSEIFGAVLKPNLSLAPNETKNRRSKAAESVPAVQEEVKKDELIVQRGMLITADEKLRLEMIQKEMAKQKVKNKLFAVGLELFLAYLLMFLYLLFFERKTLFSVRNVLLIHAILLVSLLICKAVSMWLSISPYLMPVALAPLLLTLLMGPRLGFLGAVISAVFAAPLTDLNSEIVLGALLSSAAGIFAAFHARKRIHFLKIGAAIGCSYFAVIFGFQLFQEFSSQESFSLGLFGLASGLLVTMPIAFLLLPVFEWIFNLTTDITLLELSDLNHPLLKRMIVEAPGTYHHSLVVSTLAEAACEKIEANALLARVGAYFHDIGKIARAQYFTENQAYQSPSRHEKLSPTMSCLLIMNHVKDGLEMGRRYKLKDRILQFIPEHQGTGVIYYFYKKAVDDAKPGENIRVEDFRYPGPKPQSKETAVVMLADSTEAASRSLAEPSPERIRQLVRKIINDKFIDGQLDECNLSLRDLHKIQESFVRNLMAIFHTRVRYPTDPEKRDRPSLFEEDQFSKFRVDG
ncbi:MAG TPA: HDIG domain-containing protein [bacterium]|nr:HDIG domain-containing protein [bacterium]